MNNKKPWAEGLTVESAASVSSSVGFQCHAAPCGQAPPSVKTIMPALPRHIAPVDYANPSLKVNRTER